MSTITVQQMAERVAGLMEDRLRIRGRGLSEKLARSRRILPRRVRAQARLLAEAGAMSENPHLMARIDEASVAAAYDGCIRYLTPLGRRARRRALARTITASAAFGLLAVFALVVTVLVWRGFL